jgi:hypothetical protein
MARALTTRSNTGGVDISKVTWPSQIEPAGFTFLMTIIGFLTDIASKADKKATEKIKEVLDLVVPFAGIYFSYETHRRDWVPTTDPTSRRRGSLQWRPDQPLGDLGPAAIWAGQPLSTLDGKKIVDMLKAIGLNFPKDMEDMLAQDHKSRVAASLRVGTNAIRIGTGQVVGLRPSPWVEGEDKMVYRKEVLKQGTPVTAGVPSDLDAGHLDSGDDY